MIIQRAKILLITSPNKKNIKYDSLYRFLDA